MSFLSPYGCDCVAILVEMYGHFGHLVWTYGRYGYGCFGVDPMDILTLRQDNN